MYIKNIKVDGYKNLSNIDITLNPNINIFCGENAQGKTNLLEAVWLSCGCRSFRNTKDKDFVGFERDNAEISVTFENKIREQDIKLKFSKNVKGQTVLLNGVKLPLRTKLFGSLRCVVFTPDDLELSKGSPDNRRNFIDLCISQIKISYVNAINTYNYVLSQRNAYLKNLVGHDTSHSDMNMLETWDEQLAKAGSYISVLRNNYCNNLNEHSKRLYSQISDNREKFELYYKSSVFDDFNMEHNELTEHYLSKLRKSLKNDIKAGFTTVGAHRDDVITSIDKLSSRDYASQGQCRSIALVMKLAAAKILAEEKEDRPVLLLDDVLSELDVYRRNFVLNNIDGFQTIITCCDEGIVSDIKGVEVFVIKNGEIVRS